MKRILLILFYCFTLGVGYGSGQTLAELREERIRQEEEIQYTQKLLNETADSKKNEISRLKLLNRQINNRERIITNIRKELNYINNTINKKEDTVVILGNELSVLKEDYSRMIYKAYQTRKSYDKAQYILASSDFNQAYKRIKYLQQYSRFRKQQAKEIQDKSVQLEGQVLELESAKDRQAELLNSRRSEIANLNNEKKDKDQFIQQLSKKERELRQQLAEKQRIYSQIEREISRIMAEAVKENKTGEGMAMTPEMKIISNEFGQNKGRHGWPVERGVITSKYGRHAHEVLKNVQVDNPGVDITTEPGQAIRSIFSGQVNSILSIKGGNLVVVIQHGEYFTVYTNIVNVRVKKGDLIQRYERIGNAYSGEGDKKSIFQFQIWKGTENLNPELWLAR